MQSRHDGFWIEVAGPPRSRKIHGARRKGFFTNLLTFLVLCSAAPVAAQSGPYVPIGVDLLMRGRPEEGLLILHSGYRNSPYADADAVVFLGADQSGREGDVLSVSLGLREPHGYAQARLG